MYAFNNSGLNKIMNVQMNGCIHLEALFYMVVLYLTLESSVKLEDVVCGSGKTQILGQNMNVGPTEGESGGTSLSALSSWVCTLASHAVLQGALGAEEGWCPPRGAELGLM